MKKSMKKNRVCLLLSILLLFTLSFSNGNANAANTDSSVSGLQRIGETIDSSKPVAGKVVLAVIGDYGDCVHNCKNEQAVADLVHSWNPDAILTTGDNSYRLGTVDEVQADQEPYWDDIAAGRFIPIYGNHDYGQGCSLDSIKPSLDYFKIPVSYVAGFGNGLVDFINPDVNCNVSSDNGTPPKIFDPYKQTIQGSNASWKLVGGHQPIFSSGQAGNNLNRRWLMTPGIDLILQGHDHHAEHIITPEGYNEVITGNGGQSLTPLFPPVPGSVFRDNSSYGAVRLTITPETMTVDFVNVPGTVVYSFTLKKDPFTHEAYIASRTDWTDPNPNDGGTQPIGDRTVSMAFGEDNEYKNGLDWIPYESGLAHEIELDGRTVLQIDRSPFGTGNNLYLQVQDERIYGGPYHGTATIEYRSPVAGSFVLQYESAATGVTYQSAKRVSINEDQINQWQTVTLDLPSANFTNRQNGGADMRIVAANKLPLIIGSMKIDVTPEKPVVSLWAIRIQNMDTIKVGEATQAVVNGIYSDFSSSPLSSGVTFTSSNKNVATIDPSSGMVKAVNAGDTVITATYGDMQAKYHVVVEKSDTIAPTTTLTKDGTLLEDSSYLNQVTIHLDASDDNSGVEKIEYSIDQGKTWKHYIEPFVLDQDGNNSIEFRSIDKAGNVESVQTETVKIKSANIVNFRALVLNESINQNGVKQSILSHIDNIERNFKKAADFRAIGKTDQSYQFETLGYNSLEQLSAKIEEYSDKQLRQDFKKELQTFIEYMITHKTINLQ